MRLDYHRTCLLCSVDGLPDLPPMPYRCPLGTDLSHAAALLRQGGLVAFATETVYGLGGNALDVQAVARIFAAKNRPQFDPLIVHVASRAWLPELVRPWPDLADRLMEAFWPGPLTLVLPKQPRVPDLVTSGLPHVAVRQPQHPLALELLAQAGCPIAAPSANPFGQLSPTCATDVAESLGDKIDYILDGGPCSIGVESTVVLVDESHVTLLRPGGVTYEALVEIVGDVRELVPKSPAIGPPDNSPRLAPGTLPQHYAPRTPLRLISQLSDITQPEQSGLLLLGPRHDLPPVAAVEYLAKDRNLTTAATRLFAALRRLDRANLQQIFAELMPTEGLGRAINDRLQRAARTVE